jgi:hypothetical protein
VISAEALAKATEARADFAPAILRARYHAATDQVELVTAWCTLFVDRKRIAELRDVAVHDLEGITVSQVGVHVDSADIDINAAGLISSLSAMLTEEVAKAA